LRVQEEKKVSLIDIDSHGKTNIKGMLMGSVLDKVVRRAKTRFWLLRDKACDIIRNYNLRWDLKG